MKIVIMNMMWRGYNVRMMSKEELIKEWNGE